MSTALSPRDAERLADLEVTIAQGLTTFVEVGVALSEIRESRLYRETHGTFEDYCRERWQMTDRRARQLMDAATVVGEIGTTVPLSERAIRPLTKLPPEQQREVWKEAVETAPEGKVTAAHVAAVVERRVAPTPTPPEPESVRPKRVDTHRLTALVTYAIDAAHAAENATDEQINALVANDLMLAGLRKARDLIDRIIRQHSADAKSASA